MVTVDELEVEMAMRTPSKWHKLQGFVGGGSRAGRPGAVGGGLSVFMAAVGEGQGVEDEVVDIIVGATSGGRYDLAPWSDADLMTLSERIYDLYAEAYVPGEPYRRKKPNAPSS